MLDTGIVDLNQRGEENTIGEFNRCYYPRPIDYKKFPVMSNFAENAVIL